MDEKIGNKTKNFILHRTLNKEGDTEIKEYLRGVYENRRTN